MMEITKALIKSLIREQMEDEGVPIPAEELRDVIAGSISDLYKYVNGIRPRWINFGEMSMEELEKMHRRLTAELFSTAQDEEARSYKPDYDPSDYTRSLEDRYISDHDAYEAEQERMITPEEGEELPQRQGMGRRPLVGPARDVRKGRKISEQLKELIRDEINERCQKGYKTHATRKTKQMFGRTYRNCVKAEGNMADYPVDDYGALTDDEIVARAEAAGFDEMVRHGLESEELRAEVIELLKMADMEGDSLMENNGDDAIKKAMAAIDSRYGRGATVKTDNVSKSYIKFITRNLEFRELFLDLWDDMVSGVPMKDIVTTAEEALGYKRSKDIFAPMPVVGSEEEYLFSILSGIKFHARKIRSGVKYPTREQIDDAVEEIVGMARKKVKDREAAAEKERARVDALSPEEREEEARQRRAAFAYKMSSGQYGRLD